MRSSWEEKEERGMKLDLKRRAQERTKAATTSPDIRAKKRSGTKEGEIAAMGLCNDMQPSFTFSVSDSSTTE